MDPGSPPGMTARVGWLSELFCRQEDLGQNSGLGRLPRPLAGEGRGEGAYFTTSIRTDLMSAAVPSPGMPGSISTASVSGPPRSFGTVQVVESGA